MQKAGQTGSVIPTVLLLFGANLLLSEVQKVGKELDQ